MEHKQRLISLLDTRKHFVTGEDGYVIFWPTGNNGAFTSYDLRLMADELDARNKEWDKQVRKDLTT